MPVTLRAAIINDVVDIEEKEHQVGPIAQPFISKVQVALVRPVATHSAIDYIPADMVIF